MLGGEQGREDVYNMHTEGVEKCRAPEQRRGKCLGGAGGVSRMV